MGSNESFATNLGETLKSAMGSFLEATAAVDEIRTGFKAPECVALKEDVTGDLVKRGLLAPVHLVDTPDEKTVVSSQALSGGQMGVVRFKDGSAVADLGFMMPYKMDSHGTSIEVKQCANGKIMSIEERLYVVEDKDGESLQFDAQSGKSEYFHKGGKVDSWTLTKDETKILKDRLDHSRSFSMKVESGKFIIQTKAIDRD